MTMRYFYIDTENVQSDMWVPHLKGLTAGDTVYVLSSENSAKISVKDLLSIQKCPAQIKVIDVKKVGTPNAMDFVLVAVLSQQVATAKRSMHFVISKDNGYLPAITYLKESGVYIDKIGDMHCARKELPKAVDAKAVAI